MAKEHSILSSPISVLSMGTESLGSDAGSALGLDKDPELYCVPETEEGVKAFAPGDGDLELRVNGTLFQTHKYLLKRFGGLKSLIEQKNATGQLDKILTLEREHGVEDFLNTFKILYASPIHGPLSFDSATLISTLRLATVYDYPALRTFTIIHLEKAQLSAIERIRIAREFGFTSWEEPAYVELCERDDPITEQEANVLGISAFVQVARIREKEQRRKGEQSRDWVDEDKDENTEGRKQEEIIESRKDSDGPVVMTAAQAILPKKTKKKFARKAPVTGDAHSAVSSGTVAQAKGVTEHKAAEESSPDFNPSFMGFSSSNSTFNYELGAIQSQPTHSSSSKLTKRPKHLASSIAELRSNLKDIKSALPSPQPILNADESSKSAGPTSAQAAVHKWLYGGTQSSD